MWAKTLKELVVAPLLRRVGTAMAVLLLSGGDWACRTFEACGLVNEHGAQLVSAYVVAVMLLGFDLLVSAADKWATKKKVIAEVVGK